MTLQDWLAHLDGMCAKATPHGPNTKLMRYPHGGGRLYLEDMDGFARADRDLIADFYDEDNREFYYALDPETVRLVLDVVRAAQDYAEAYDDLPPLGESQADIGPLENALDRLASHVEGKEVSG